MSNNQCTCDSKQKCLHFKLNLKTAINPNSPRTPINGHNKVQIWTDAILLVPVLGEEKIQTDQTAVYPPRLQHRSCLCCKRSQSTVWRHTQIPRFTSETLSRNLLWHSQAQENLAAFPKATSTGEVQQWLQELPAQGLTKKGVGCLGSRCPSPLPCCYALVCYLPPRMGWNQETVQLFSCLLGNFLLSRAGSNLASRCPSTQKDHMKCA